jgi:hypothetical protein
VIKLRVISTGLNAPTKDRCIASVKSQRLSDGVFVRHDYVDSDPAVDVITNLSMLIRTMDPDAIVVWLDGDDHLVRPDACAIVQAMHEAGAWVTWGSFVYADGRPGFAAPVNWGAPIRRHPWVTTHLKSFRAGLFQRLRREDLEWPLRAQVPWDMVVMFAAIEMAGGRRCTYCPEVLSAYHVANSNEWKNGPGEERRYEAIIRARDPYPLLEAP